MAKSYFKLEHDLEKRRAEAATIREKYPDRIPVIVEKAEQSDLDKKKIKLSAEKAIFIFIDNVLPPTGATMSAIYEEKKDEDGFLYATYSGENTFGLRLVPEETSISLTGFEHNAVTCIDMKTDIPVILDEAIAKLDPKFFWLGSGEVDLKLGVDTSEFINFVKSFIFSCSS